MAGPDLVTGATGFIGSHLVRRLLDHERPVRVLCRRGSEGKLRPDVRRHVDIALGDLGDRSSLMAAAIGTARVFHCAGEVSDWGSFDRFRDVNVRGTSWLLEAARQAGAERFVHLSSFVVFGTPSPTDIHDDLPYGTGADAYTTTKIAGDRAVLSFGAVNGLSVVVLRPAVVYGNGSTWLEEPVRMMQRRAFFLLGGGEGTCHPCYVENLLDATLLAAGHPRAVGRAYLVADDDPLSFRSYFGAIASLCGAAPPRRSIPVPVARAVASILEGFARATRATRRPLLTHAAIDLVCTRSSLSIARIRDELGFSPRYSFQGAIEELAALRRRVL